MACPDRNKDKKIIQEVERRKTSQPTIRETYNEEYLDIDLSHLVQFLDETDVVAIYKTINGWSVTKYVSQ